MAEGRNGPGWAGYAWLTLFCVTAILGGSLVFSQGAVDGKPSPELGRKSIEQIAGTPQQGSKTEQELVVELRIRGHDQVPVEKIIRQIHTRTGRPYEPDMVEEDVRRLYHTRMFTDVKASTQQVSGGRVVIFEVHERPTLDSVKYVGNEKIKRKQLSKEAGFKKGDPADPYAVEEGRRKLEEYYKTKGFSKVQVSIVEGNKPNDRRVIYLIDEGPKERHLWTQFVGNTIASDARLRTQIKSKPGVFWFLGGTVDPKQVEEDINRLTAYYRSLGFMKAEVGRELQWNEDHNWLTLTFVINEGPRYKVRNVSVIGNAKFSTEALTEDLKLKSGNYFNQDEMTADVLKMQDIYGGAGYVFADVKADPRFLEEPGLLDLVYEIKEGARYKISRIDVQIKGENPHTKWSTVLDRTSIIPGQIADVREFRASERRVKASQIFAADPMKGSAPKLTFKPPETDKSETEMADEPPRPGGKFRGQSPDPESPADEGSAASPRQPVHRFQDAGYDDGGGYSVPSLRSNTSPARSPLQTIDPGSDRRTPTGMFSAPAGNTVPAVTYPGTGTATGAVAGAGVDPGVATQAPAGPPTGQWLTQPAPAVPSYPLTGSQGWFGSGPSGWGNRQGLDPMAPLTGGAPYEEPPVDLPLGWRVEETTTGRFMFSIGVNSDAGLVGSIVVDEQNFDWTRWPQGWEDVRTGTAFRGAGQRFRVEAMPGTSLQRYTASFTEPYLFGTKISLGLSGYYYDRAYTEWTERRIGGRIALGYQFRPDLSATIAYNGESIAVYSPEEGDSGVVPPVIQEVVGNNVKHSFRTQLTYDTRDNAFLPTEGWLFEAGVEQAVGSYSYPRADLDVRKYFLIKQRPDGSGRHVLSLSSRFGVTGHTTPVYDHYFAGGFSTIRGFYFRDASPMDDGVVVGGHFMLLNSAEYLFPITADDTLRGVVFCDTGTVEPSINNWTDKYRVAAGFGVRITIPAMGPAPIALDFAFPIVKNPGDREQVFSFFIGFLR